MKVISNPVPVIVNYINQSASTSIIGFARSLLALGLLLTLIFNNINVLIPAHYIATLNQGSIQFHGNFFFLLGPSHLNITRLLAVVSSDVNYYRLLYAGNFNITLLDYRKLRDDKACLSWRRQYKYAADAFIDPCMHL